MNKSILFSLFAVIMLLSSCRQLSTLSVEKRHYRSGYHIEYSNRVQKEKTVYTASAELPAEKISASASDVPAVNLVPEKLKMETEDPEIVPEAASKKIYSNFYAATPHLKIAELKKPIGTVKQIVSADKKHEDGLSMFWAIIVLIVIIWLLAYFTGGWGLGGLINLLLLVALILLVLWLLGVV